MFGIPGGDDNGGVTAQIQSIRDYEQRRQPAPVGIAGAAAEAVGDVIDAAKAVVRTKTESARDWLAARLQHGAVDAWLWPWR
jgi:hypothetical protein